MAVQSGNADNAVFERGEWCVGLFNGVKRRKLSYEGQQQRECRHREIQNPEELLRLRATGAQLLQSYANALPVPKTLHSIDAPRVDMNVEDKPQTPAPIDLVRQQIHREVSMVGFNYIRQKLTFLQLNCNEYYVVLICNLFSAHHRLWNH